jgi:hypothetical protein
VALGAAHFLPDPDPALLHLVYYMAEATSLRKILPSSYSKRGPGVNCFHLVF